MIRTLQVELGARSYPIDIGPGVLSRLDTQGQRCLVVSNDTVAPLHLKTLLAQLPEGTATCILPDGEAHETLDSAGVILDALAAGGFHRDGLVIALGGGVIGDLAGFAAAVYHRGIAFIQIPTTLLSMVDSSVGGKTGVNHPAGKNLIGAFHQPRQVLADLQLLDTLPSREYAMVERCCATKARIVAADEREQGQRALLNLGHTFGHAIETASGYGTVLHGEAVAIGMVMAADLSYRLGWTSLTDVERLRDLLQALDLPTRCPPIPPEQFLALMQRDKKVLNNRLRLVLLKPLGQAIITADVPPEPLQETLLAAT